MSDAQKLTKKQRKSLAFREKLGKNKSKKPDPLDVPEADDVDKDENVDEAGDVKQKEKVLGKRKRADGEGQLEIKHKPSKAAKTSKLKPKQVQEASNAEEDEVDDAEDDDENIPPSASSSKKARYILFIGTLPYPNLSTLF